MVLEKKKVTIVVPALNAENTIEFCLKSIQELDTSDDRFSLNYEVVVVDNNSIDSTAKLAAALGVKCIFAEKRNRSLARNLGYLNSDSEFVAFVDSDVVLKKDWLLKMMQEIVESPLFGGGDSFIHSAFEGKKTLIEELRQFLKSTQNNLLSIQGRDFPMINSAACLYRRSALDSVKGFDENLNSYEDIDLSKRILWAGWMLFCSEDAEAFCYNDKATIRGFAKRYFEMGRNRFLYVYKWKKHDRGGVFISEINSAIFEALQIGRAMLGASWNLRLPQLLLLINFLFFVKLVGSLSMVIKKIDITKKNFREYLPVLDFQNQKWSLVSYKSHYLLHRPSYETQGVMFRKFSKTLNVGFFLKFCARKNHEAEG